MLSGDGTRRRAIRLLQNIINLKDVKSGIIYIHICMYDIRSHKEVKY